MLTFYPSRIPDPGVKKAPNPGSGSATLITDNWPSTTGTCTGSNETMPLQLTSGVRSPTQMLVSTSPGARRVLLWFSLNLGADKVGMKNDPSVLRLQNLLGSDLTDTTVMDTNPNLTGSTSSSPSPYCDRFSKNRFKTGNRSLFIVRERTKLQLYPVLGIHDILVRIRIRTSG
jgi:hypothetical protein